MSSNLSYVTYGEYLTIDYTGRHQSWAKRKVYIDVIRQFTFLWLLFMMKIPTIQQYGTYYHIILRYMRLLFFRAYESPSLWYLL